MLKDKIRNEACNAAAALDEVSAMFISMFESMGDEYFRERAADIKDIQDQNFSDILYYLIRYACRIEFMQSVFAAITKITQGLIVHAFLFTFHFC